MTHVSIDNITAIVLINGLLPGSRHAVIGTNAGILLIEPLVTNFGEILIESHIFELEKMQLKLLFVKWQTFCIGLNVVMMQHEITNRNVGSLD